jgi:cyclophilin family peptidyl-prolyl cis-trans isomerase
MRKCLRWVVAWSVVGFAVGLAVAAAPASAGEPGPKRAEWDKLYPQWQKIIAQLRRLRDEYRNADPGQTAGIEKRYNELIAEGEALMPKIGPAAEAAFLEDPAANKDVGELLMGIAMDHFRADAYEETLRLSKLLMDNGYDDKFLCVPAGWAAFGVGEFDLARKYLDLARQRKTLEKFGKEIAEKSVMFLSEVPFYRTAWKKEQAIRESEAKAKPDELLPRVRLKTTKGQIDVELFENEAPNTVANFISLVEKKYYNGAPFHRVLPQFMAQGGDPTGTGAGGPGYAIPCECYRPGARVHFRGSLSMAHAGRDTGGSQFFLCFLPAHHLDGRHTCFGRVIEGLDVLSKLQRIDPDKPDESVKPDKIVEATVLRKRAHPYEPKKLPEQKRGFSPP